MTAPVRRSRWSQYREPSYVLLMVGTFLTAFGFSSLLSGRRPVINVVVAVVGLALLIAMRVMRSRSGRRP